MSASPRAYIDLLVDMIENFIAHGFRRIVIVNGHGGNNVPGQQAIFEVRQKHRDRDDLLLLFACYWALGGKPHEVDAVARAAGDGPRLRMGDVDDPVAGAAPGRRLSSRPSRSTRPARSIRPIAPGPPRTAAPPATSAIRASPRPPRAKPCSSCSRPTWSTCSSASSPGTAAAGTDGRSLRASRPNRTDRRGLCRLHAAVRGVDAPGPPDGRAVARRPLSGRRGPESGARRHPALQPKMRRGRFADPRLSRDLDLLLYAA